MVQPPGFIKAGHESKVCKLFKVLYGLRQGGRCWYSCICKAFAKFGYMHCQVNHCTFYKGTESSIIIVVVAMDDLTLAFNSPSLLLSCKLDLQYEFEISNMEEIHWLLGVEIKRDRHT